MTEVIYKITLNYCDKNIVRRSSYRGLGPVLLLTLYLAVISEIITDYPPVQCLFVINLKCMGVVITSASSHYNNKQADSSGYLHINARERQMCSIIR